MKILVISQMFPCKRHPTSGIFFANLMKALARLVDDLIIVTPRVYIPKCLTVVKKKWAKRRIDDMRTYKDRMEIVRPFVPFLPGVSSLGLNGILMEQTLRRLVKIYIDNKRVDLILGYNMLPEGVAAMRLAKAFRLPVGFWCIGSDINDFAEHGIINRRLAKRTIIQSDLVLTESKDLENKVRRLVNRGDGVKTFYKGIDLSNFQDLPSRDVLCNQLGLDRNKNYLLFVGRLIYDKGIYELAESFAMVTRLYPRHELILVGEEIEKASLLKKFAALGVLERVHFRGIVPYNVVAYYMKLSDILILPTWAEGLPNVVMEAMAIGLPVVATNVDGLPEILENRVTGLSVPPKNAGQLTKATITLIEDDRLRENCIRNARELILGQFDVKKNVAQLYDLLKTLQV